MNRAPTRPWLFWLFILAALFAFIYAIKAILLPFLVGIAVAYFLDPAADRIERRGASRTMATLMITFVFFGLMAVGLIFLIPTLLEQAESLIRHLPGYIEQLRTQVDALSERYLTVIAPQEVGAAKDAAQNSSGELAKAATKLLKGLLSSGAAIVNLLSLIIISPIVSFYLLRDWDRIIAKIDELLPRHYAETIREQAANIDETISGFVRGTLNVMLVLALFYAIGLSAIGLNFAILIGLLGGIAIIIPYIGTIISGAAAVGMAYVQFESWEPVAITLAIFSAGQVLEGYVLTPKLVGDKIGLHPLWLIFGMLCGAALFGFVGILLAIPTTAIIGVLIRFAAERYKQSDYYQDAPSTDQ